MFRPLVKFLSLAAVVVTASVHAQQGVVDPVVPLVPGPGFPGGGQAGAIDSRLATKAFYDCAVGPGYLVFRVVDPSGFQYRETVYMGSRAKCLAQVKELWKTRGTITEASTVAFCVTAGGPTFLRRRVIYPAGHTWGGYLSAGLVQRVPDQEYPVKECLDYAAELNGTGAQLPPAGDAPGNP